MIYELAEHDDIKMLETDFAFEDGFVCLGTELYANSFDTRNVVTTVDQCLIQGCVECQDNAVIHNAIRYTALQDTHIEASVETKAGSWKRNNIALADESVSADVLTLTIHYPAECKYAYMISAADTQAPKVEVLQNDAAVQAIRLPGGQVMAVLHQPAVLSVDGREFVGDAGTIIC